MRFFVGWWHGAIVNYVVNLNVFLLLFFLARLVVFPVRHWTFFTIIFLSGVGKKNVCIPYRYLRSQKPYTPPENVSGKINTILKNFSTPITIKTNGDVLSIGDKYRILNECFQCFQHGVPNSQVHEMKTVG